MPLVKVRRRNISAQEAAAAISASLGGKLKITPVGDRELNIKKNVFVQAKASISEEAGGTVFNVRGSGTFPLFVITMLINNMGIARQVATVIGENQEFQADD
jgi:hypothetical protein